MDFDSKIKIKIRKILVVATPSIYFTFRVAVLFAGPDKFAPLQALRRRLPTLPRESVPNPGPSSHYRLSRTSITCWLIVLWRFAFQYQVYSAIVRQIKARETSNDQPLDLCQVLCLLATNPATIASWTVPISPPPI